MKAIKTFCYSAALLSAGLLFFVTACNENEKDVTKPVITVEEPAEGDTVHAGEAHGLHMEFDLEDESGLNEYKVDVHYGGDHSHSSYVKTTGTGWSFQKTYGDAKGLRNHHAHHHSDSIPADAALGEYHLGILATDVHGNEASVYRTFTLVAPDNHDHDHDHEDDHEHEDE
ncbi:MAG: DUF4625 domain-containing protein [Prevotellaceae bacterium]|jgi:hypothetical protein|nr:DUF4625 domain-containing protein [Prevotellaceae bacterium]